MDLFIGSQDFLVQKSIQTDFYNITLVLFFRALILWNPRISGDYCHCFTKGYDHSSDKRKPKWNFLDVLRKRQHSKIRTSIEHPAYIPSGGNLDPRALMRMTARESEA